MNKFYKGDGYPFEPFSFKESLAQLIIEDNQVEPEVEQ